MIYPYHFFNHLQCNSFLTIIWSHCYMTYACFSFSDYFNT
ncbi:hypothetical protein BMB171_C2627 [Bacillus thuringiensis BMB171]|nr:hypothetical protein BMB171_C2627 [Bacillus thuringiensis BMB171]